MWQLIAQLLAYPPVARWLYRRAQRTPYRHLGGYMRRWWLFNGYDRPGHISWLPSIRMHHIEREDVGRHLHDHPWNARTFVIAGGYLERRVNGALSTRLCGDTATLKYGEYHSIDRVMPGGAWTIFVTGRKRGTWGFLVDGQKIPHHVYLAERE